MDVKHACPSCGHLKHFETCSAACACQERAKLTEKMSTGTPYVEPVGGITAAEVGRPVDADLIAGMKQEAVGVSHE